MVGGRFRGSLQTGYGRGGFGISEAAELFSSWILCPGTFLTAIIDPFVVETWWNFDEFNADYAAKTGSGDSSREHGVDETYGQSKPME